MCDCISKTMDAIKAAYSGELETRGSVQSVDLQTTLIREGTNLKVATYSDVEIRFVNKKKPLKTVLVHSYCPICGEKKV